MGHIQHGHAKARPFRLHVTTRSRLWIFETLWRLWTSETCWRPSSCRNMTDAKTSLASTLRQKWWSVNHVHSITCGVHVFFSSVNQTWKHRLQYKWKLKRKIESLSANIPQWNEPSRVPVSVLFLARKFWWRIRKMYPQYEQQVYYIRRKMAATPCVRWRSVGVGKVF